MNLESRPALRGAGLGPVGGNGDFGGGAHGARGTGLNAVDAVQRGDAETIRTHAAALAGAPRHVADLYRASARALLEIAMRRGLSEASATAIEGALNG